MIHKANLLARVRLPPKSENFPHPALLHAICAAAAIHTAWVNSLPPEALEDHLSRTIADGGSLESLDDFGLAQAESARRAMHMSTSICGMGSGQLMFELCQTSVGHDF